MKLRALAFLLLGFGLLPLRAQQEAAGVLIFQQPSSTFTEAVEYRSFHQDNALYATVVTMSGQPRKLKAAAVIKALAYPPLTLDPAFEELAPMNLAQITQLEARYPRVRPQLKTARNKWERALLVFRDNKPKPQGIGVSRPGVSQGHSSWPKGARLTSGSPDSATVTDATGVRTFPLKTLTAAQVLALNETSRTIQLPLGLRSSVPSDQIAASGKAAEPDGLTQRLEMAGRGTIAAASHALGVPDRSFSVWTFFVVLPALVVILLIALFSLLRRSGATVLPQRQNSL